MPDAPAYARPVHVAAPKVGDDILVVAMRERAGRLRANDIIGCFAAWHAAVKADYGAEAAAASANLAQETCEQGGRGKP